MGVADGAANLADHRAPADATTGENAPAHMGRAGTHQAQRVGRCGVAVRITKTGHEPTGHPAEKKPLGTVAGWSATAAGTRAPSIEERKTYP